MTTRTYQEIKADIEIVENELSEMEYSFIEEHGICSRSGYIPQSFDEIGNEELRTWEQEKFNEDNLEILMNYEMLKDELAKAGETK